MANGRALEPAPAARSTHGSSLGRRLFIFVLIWGAYLPAYWFYVHELGNRSGTLAAVTVVLAAWLLGARYGFVAGLAIVPLNALLAGHGLAYFHSAGNLSEPIVAALLGAAFGRMTDVGRQLRAEAEKRRAAEEHLIELNNSLEERIADRTAEIAASNSELEREVAERRRVERALRLSEEQFRELFENASDVVYTHDLMGRILSVNRVGTELSGYSRTELVAMNIGDIIVPEDLDRARQMIERKVVQGDNTRYELELMARCGQRTPVEVSTRLILEDGRPAAIQGIARDISARKAADLAQRRHLHYLESMNRIAATLDQHIDYDAMMKAVVRDVVDIFAADRAYILFPLDPNAEQFHIPYLAGRSEWIKGRRERDFPIGPEEAGLMRHLLESDGPVLFEPESAALEIPLHRDLQIASQMAIPLRPRLGKPWLLGVHQCGSGRVWNDAEKSLFWDIARRVTDALTNALLYRDLIESEAKFRSLVENSADGIFRADADGKLAEANPALAHMFGFSSAEELIAESSRRPLGFTEEEWQALLEAESTHQTRLRRRDGKEIWVEANVRTVRDANGKVIAREGFLRDLTERRRAEEERRRLEARIQESQKMESLGILAGGIAHDFNNLLVGILGNSGIALLELPADAPARASVERIETAALRAAELTNQMLAYSGRGRFVIQPVDLGQLVREMAELLETTIPKTVRLELEFPSDLPFVEGDATQLRQVFMNLLTNAADAIGEAVGTISIRAKVLHADRALLTARGGAADLPEGEYVSIEVVDTGSGMDADTLPRIFEPFFTTKFTGRGLGLAAVLGIIRGHKGAIGVYSEPNRGTHFSLLLPASRHTEPLAERPSDDVGGYQGSGTVLVIDDEPVIREVTRHMLEKFGFAVRTAEDGESGIAIFEAETANIVAIILDMTMPRMSGEEVLRELRRRSASVPILLSSGFSEPDVTAPFEEGEISGFIQKPYRPHELLARLRTVLERPAAEAPSVMVET